MDDRPWALVTGASSGIGREFARQLAARGHSVALVARSTGKLEALADELDAAYGADTTVISQDLAEPDAGERVASLLYERGVEVEVLVNNAGIGKFGASVAIDAAFEHQEVMVNVVALTDLVKRYLPPMTERGSGSIVNVASIAGFQPQPYMALYAATKAFVVNYSLGLWVEARGSGVKVLAVCPGPVDTGFPVANRIRYNRALLGWMLADPAKVVAQSLAALDKDKGYVVPDRRNWPEAHLLPRRPRKLVARVVGAVLRRFSDAQNS
ncbi:SDR family NAD(P)-dependent oxidoreductase [Glycomyces tarimensis]